MSLTGKYTVAVSRIPELFAKIRDGQAPEQLSRQLLKDWGFSSSNDRAFVPILKDLGFLSPDGKPTARYHEYRDHSRSKAVMAQALRDAYGDLFLIKEHPSDADKAAIQGKFKSFHNASDLVSGLMSKTFFELLKLADLNSPHGKDTLKSTRVNKKPPDADSDEEGLEPPEKHKNLGRPHGTGLHYNIQIHLPATKDVEVYNAIFKSLREHLFEK